MRVLSTLTYYHPHWTGLTNLARRIAEGLVRRGHTVTVLTTRHEPGLARDEMVSGIRVLRLRPWAFISRGAVAPSWPWQLARLLPERLGLPPGAAPFVAAPGGWRWFHWLGDLYGRAALDLLRYRVPAREDGPIGLCLGLPDQPLALPPWPEAQVALYLEDSYRAYEPLLSLGPFQQLLPLALRRRAVVEQFDVPRFMAAVARSSRPRSCPTTSRPCSSEIRFFRGAAPPAPASIPPGRCAPGPPPARKAISAAILVAHASRRSIRACAHPAAPGFSQACASGIANEAASFLGSRGAAPPARRAGELPARRAGELGEGRPTHPAGARGRAAPEPHTFDIRDTTLHNTPDFTAAALAQARRRRCRSQEQRRRIDEPCLS